MIRTPESISSSATSCALPAGTATTPTMMFFSRTASASRRESLIEFEPIVRPTLSGSLSKTAAMLIPCSAKIGELAIAWPSRPGADERDVVLALGTQDLPDLAEQRVDVVADSALAELAEGRRGRGGSAWR